MTVVREDEDNDQSPTSSGSSASEGTEYHRLELNSDRPVAVLDQLRGQREEEAQENVDVQETVEAQRVDMAEIRGISIVPRRFRGGVDENVEEY